MEEDKMKRKMQERSAVERKKEEESGRVRYVV